MTPPAKRVGGRAASPAELSERELAVLADLARVRLLTGRHVQRLHFGAGSPLTAARRARSLLQRLSERQLVVRLERRIGGLHAGSSGFVYGLSARGQWLVSGRGPAGGRRLRRPWEPSSLFTDHVLAVSELYVRLREAEEQGELDLLGFDAEPAGWRWWLGPGGERLVLKPDAVVALAAGDYEYRSFVELDRSTESRTVILRKAEAYVRYWREGSEQQRLGLFPRVVWLVPDERRKVQLVDALSRLAPDTGQLFQVALHEAAVPALSGRAA